MIVRQVPNRLRHLSESEKDGGVADFDQMDLRIELLRGIYAYGFETPSNVQQCVIGPMVAGRDVVVQAGCGCGRTSALAIALLQRMDFSRPQVAQGLVLCPTRELAVSTAALVSNIGDFLRPADPPSWCASLVGGRPLSQDFARLSQGAVVIVGTPGRVTDLVVNRGALRLTGLRFVAVDQTDELLRMGFMDQLIDLFKHVPPAAQVSVFSTTMPPEVAEVAAAFTKSPVILRPRRDVRLRRLREMHHSFIVVHESMKMDALVRRCLQGLGTLDRTVIFAATPRRAEWASLQLGSHGLRSCWVHSGMAEDKLSKVFDEAAAILCTPDSDIAFSSTFFARKFINFDLFDSDIEEYGYRADSSSGTTSSDVLSFVCEEDVDVIERVEKRFRIELGQLMM